MDAWAARIAGAGLFYANVLTAADANAETLALKCSIGGEGRPRPFNVDKRL